MNKVNELSQQQVKMAILDVLNSFIPIRLHIHRKICINKRSYTIPIWNEVLATNVSPSSVEKSSVMFPLNHKRGTTHLAFI